MDFFLIILYRIFRRWDQPMWKIRDYAVNTEISQAFQYGVALFSLLGFYKKTSTGGVSNALTKAKGKTGCWLSALQTFREGTGLLLPLAPSGSLDTRQGAAPDRTAHPLGPSASLLHHSCNPWGTPGLRLPTRVQRKQKETRKL